MPKFAVAALRGGDLIHFAVEGVNGMDACNTLAERTPCLRPLSFTQFEPTAEPAVVLAEYRNNPLAVGQ